VTPELVQTLDRLELALGMRLHDRALLLEAITHRSFVNEVTDPGVVDNERLEFLGDAVLSVVVATELVRRFPHAKEGTLSRLRASMVDEPALSIRARELQLGDALRLGRGEELSGGRQRASILADALEAIVGATYVDGGFEAARALLLRVLAFPEDADDFVADPKTQLQEHLQALRRGTPRYRIVGEEGPDHAKVFEVEVMLDEAPLGRARGRTKKEAERRAAELALRDLEPS
jgi:ribonuclease-3